MGEALFLPIERLQNMPKEGVFIIYGPPGSGKGTQARKLAEHFNLEHFDTGRAIEKKVHDPSLQNDPIIQKERRNFDSGLLCTPDWAARIVIEETKKLHQSGRGVVFSGSPRTFNESKVLIPFLENLYGRGNICVFRLIIKPETSIFRNSHRRICEKCGHTLVYSKENRKLKKCPKCGGKLVTRVLDKPETIKIRLKEYEERTAPIYSFLKERGIKIMEIDGEPSVDEVHKNILENLK